MQLIIATIKTGDIGSKVANLQKALFALLDKQIIQALDAPNRPTQEDLQRLTERLKTEREQWKFGDTTQQLVNYFQLQQGLGDSLRGVVEETTAEKLNGFLSQLDLLEQPVSNQVDGKVSSQVSAGIGGLRVVIVDTGPRNKLGEGSVALHQALGNDPFMLRFGVRRARKGIGDRDVVYLLFPRTAQAGHKLDTAAIDRLAGAQLQAFGGIERLKECAE